VRTITIALAAVTLALSACSGDTGGDATDDAASDTGSVSDTVADGVLQLAAAQRLIDTTAQQGIQVDADCIRTLTGQLTDDDAKTILDTPGTSFELSPAGEVLETMFNTTCLDIGPLIDRLLENFPDDVDKECIRQRLLELNDNELAGGTVPADLTEALRACSND
jgi:hypothetical protein